MGINLSSCMPEAILVKGVMLEALLASISTCEQIRLRDRRFFRRCELVKSAKEKFVYRIDKFCRLADELRFGRFE